MWYRRCLLKLNGFLILIFCQKIWLGRAQAKTYTEHPYPLVAMALVKWKFHPFLELLRLL